MKLKKKVQGAAELGPRGLKKAPGEMCVAEISRGQLFNYFRSLSNDYHTPRVTGSILSVVLEEYFYL